MVFKVHHFPFWNIHYTPSVGSGTIAHRCQFASLVSSQGVLGFGLRWGTRGRGGSDGRPTSKPRILMPWPVLRLLLLPRISVPFLRSWGGLCSSGKLGLQVCVRFGGLVLCDGLSLCWMVLYGLVMVVGKYLMALVKMCHVVETRVFLNMACDGGLSEIMLSRVLVCAVFVWNYGEWFVGDYNLWWLIGTGWLAIWILDFVCALHWEFLDSGVAEIATF